MESLGGKATFIALIHVNYDISFILFFKLISTVCVVFAGGMSVKLKRVTESPGSMPALASLFVSNPHTKRSLL